MMDAIEKIDDETAERDRRLYLILMLYGASIQGPVWTPLPASVRERIESKSARFISERDYRQFLVRCVDAGIIEEKNGQTGNLAIPMRDLRFRLAVWLAVVIAAAGRMGDCVRRDAAKKFVKAGSEGSD